MIKKNMKRLRVKISNFAAHYILKGENLIIETRDESNKNKKEFIVKVIKIVSDIPKCSGCGIRLDNKQSYKYKTGHYCWDCVSRRRSDQREITQLSANKKKEKQNG